MPWKKTKYRLKNYVAKSCGFKNYVVKSLISQQCRHMSNCKTTRFLEHGSHGGQREGAGGRVMGEESMKISQ